MDTAWKHTTVLLNEAVDALFSNPDESDDSIATRQTYVDATFGRGGHSRLILSRLQAQGRLIAFDKDPEALIEAASIHDSRFSIRHQGFSQLSELPAASIAGVLLDLAVAEYAAADAAWSGRSAASRDADWVAGPCLYPVRMSPHYVLLCWQDWRANSKQFMGTGAKPISNCR